MRLHLPKTNQHTLPLRGRLLTQALRAHLEASGHTLAPPEARALEPTLARAALPAQPNAPQTLSVGLGLPHALAEGPATALLVQPLADELASLAPDTTWTHAGSVPMLLQGYRRAILFDRSDVTGSLGFAPWIDLQLSERFPITAPKPDSAKSGSDIRLLILNHAAAPGQIDALRFGLDDLDLPTRVVGADTGFADLGAGLAADLHVHLGYDPLQPTVAFSPHDSILSGLYTLVLPARSPGPALRDLCTGRSYADIAPDLSGLMERARRMATRLRAIRDSGALQNPELARFAAQNAASRAADFKRFDAVLDTVSPQTKTKKEVA